MSTSLQEKGMRRVFCRYIRRNGKVYYPRRAKCFTFMVKR